MNYRGLAAPAARGVGGAAVLGAVTVTGSLVAIPESQALTASQAGTLSGALPAAPTEGGELVNLATYRHLVLRSGAQGDAISYLQERLNDRGASLRVDGSFGPSTLRAVKAVQKNGGVGVDGVVGPNTWAVLIHTSAKDVPATSKAAPKSSGETRYSDTVLRYGQKGKNISYLQARLNDRGAGISVDGSFGPATLKAVKAVQKNGGARVDGVVGPKTWAILVHTSASEAPATSMASVYHKKTLSYGDRGDAVRYLQKGLNSRGASISVDGKFGPGTKSAVRSLQSSAGLRADGVVGPATWKALDSGSATASNASNSTAWPGDSIVAMAKDQIGVDYVWGGEDRSGMDCSGLVQYVYSRHGIETPRVARNQVFGGKIISASEAKKGDLVAFTAGNYGHIGIYAGNGMIIDASNSRGQVSYRSIWNSPHVYVTYR